VLRRITKHHKTGKIMPEHLIAKLVKSRVANAGDTTVWLGSQPIFYHQC
jgi:Zn-dependent oligopeptidase